MTGSPKTGGNINCRRLTEQQIVCALKQPEGGEKVAELPRMTAVRPISLTPDRIRSKIDPLKKMRPEDNFASAANASDHQPRFGVPPSEKQFPINNFTVMLPPKRADCLKLEGFMWVQEFCA